MRGGKGWTRAEIDQHTPAEIGLAMDDDFEKPRPASGSIVFRNPAEKAAYYRWRRECLWERLAAAVEDWQ